jgi:coatomer subunit beta'
MTYAERPNESLVEAFKSMNMEEEIPSENGDPAHEVVHLVVMLDSLVA